MAPPKRTVPRKRPAPTSSIPLPSPPIPTTPQTPTTPGTALPLPSPSLYAGIGVTTPGGSPLPTYTPQAPAAAAPTQPPVSPAVAAATVYRNLLTNGISQPVAVPRQGALSALSATAAKNVPAFLNKLYNMVEDPKTDNLIHWGEDGTTFIVERHEDFARDVLPRFFKHGNFASFVRQLNMYGFHKVPHLQQGVLISDGEPELWEFRNENFQRNQPDLLVLVSRKKGKEASEDKEAGVVDMNNLIQEIAAVKRHQLTISADLKTIQRDNQVLWTESMNIRERYQRQQETIDKILRFLASVFSTKKKPLMNKKRRLLLGEKKTPEEEEADDEEEDVDHDFIMEGSPGVVNQRVLDLIARPTVSPTSLKDNGALTLLSSAPFLFSDVNGGQHVAANERDVNNVLQRTNEVAQDLELLQDHLQNISSMVGIETPLEDLEDMDMAEILGRDGVQGTEEDRETLLALMQHHNTPSPPSTTGIGGDGTLAGEGANGLVELNGAPSTPVTTMPTTTFPLTTIPAPSIPATMLPTVTTPATALATPTAFAQSDLMPLAAQGLPTEGLGTEGLASSDGFDESLLFDFPELADENGLREYLNNPPV
ncbi:stress-responsive transcription factor hsf1 [Borealophlyctis nickersoniae]|nr:stress-responsive transcription factor hsf1 [Borealophlyctis nickersoniae]